MGGRALFLPSISPRTKCKRCPLLSWQQNSQCVKPQIRRAVKAAREQEIADKIQSALTERTRRDSISAVSLLALSVSLDNLFSRAHTFSAREPALPKKVCHLHKVNGRESIVLDLNLSLKLNLNISQTNQPHFRRRGRLPGR